MGRIHNTGVQRQKKGFVPFARPSITRADLEAVLDAMVTDQIGTNEIATQYAQDLAAQHQCAKAIVLRDVQTASSELYALCAHKQLRTLLFSPLTHIHWIEACKAQGSFDIQYAPLVSGTLVADYEQNIAQCDAVIADNTLGHIPDYRAIVQSGKLIIEIISSGVGGIYKGKRIGSFGDIVLIELESDQIITCGGGVAMLFRRESDWKIFQHRIKTRREYMVISDVNAALGITQLRCLPQFVKKRKAAEARYMQVLSSSKRFCYRTPFSSQHTPHSFPLRYHGSRKEIMRFAHTHGVEVQSAFSQSIATHALDEIDLQQREHRMYLDEVTNQTVLFPLYPYLLAESVHKVERVIANLP